MLQPFRNIIIMSAGYVFAVGSILIMYTLLPVIFFEIRGATWAGVAIMLMTMLQILLFWPLAANLVDTYGAKKMLYSYIGFFIIGALLRSSIYHVDDIFWKSVLAIGMILCFAAWFWSRFVDVYTLRVSPRNKIGISFGILVTLAWLWRFIGTLLQPSLISDATQIYAPWILIGCMLIFGIALLFVKSDLQLNFSTLFNKKEGVEQRIRTSLFSVLGTYKNTFYRGWRFIHRCRHFPLIPLSISLFEGLYFGSLWFIIPLYLAAHPDFISSGLEIGIYEIISVCVAVAFGYLADKGKSTRNVIIWWIGVLVGVWILYFHPSVTVLVTVGIIIGLSNNLLYATGQHILAKNDVDHENDGAYAQTRNIIANIGYMFMPVLWWLLIAIDFSLILKLFSSMMASVAILWLIIAFYLLVVRERNNNR